MTSDICISGLGVICAAGTDRSAILKQLSESQRPPLARASSLATIDYPVFAVDSPLTPLPEPYTRSRSLTLAMTAVRQALNDAGLKASRGTSNTRWPAPHRVAVCVGTTVACQLNSVPFYQAVREQGQGPLEPVIDFYHANLGQAISTLICSTGPYATVVNACSSGADAIGLATQWIRAGLCDIAIAGGADELHRIPLTGFYSLGVMSSEACRPFDTDRDGLNLGEGAGFVVLESQAHALARGRSPDFTLAGFGAACDAHHLTAPHPQGRGLLAAIKQAMTQANITPNDIAFINAHGTATPDNDHVESTALHQVFGDQACMVSTKGYTGHTLGAAGGVEAVLTILGLEQGWIPANVGYSHQNTDDTPLAPVTARTAIQGQYALSTSLAFGGNNAALVIKKQFAVLATNVVPTTPQTQDTSHLPAVAILGSGAMTTLGRGLDNIAAQIEKLAACDDVADTAAGLTAKMVDDKLLADPDFAKQLRRANRFVRLATLSAIDAWKQAEPHLGSVSPERVGMVIASGFGPHVRGFKFLDGVLDYGDTAALPTDFSHSVHGAASAYIASLLDVRGPTFSLTDFQAGFHQAVLTAQCWLDQNICDYVLVGAAEELGDVLLNVTRQSLPSGAQYTVGEGALFLVLTRTDNHLKAITLQAALRPAKVDLLLGAQGVYPPKANALPTDVTFQTHSSMLPWLGHNTSATAFETLGGLLAMSHPTLPLWPSKTLFSLQEPRPTPAPVGRIDSAMAFVSLSDTTMASLTLTRPRS